jgi:hypothetical protein
LWDLDQIVRQNNQAALESIMRGRKADEAQSPQPEGWALSLLADILKVGPPLLTEIMGCLEQIETVKEFRALVRMLLPEYESEIMSAPRNRRVYKFCYYFGLEYYPLPANTDCHPADWVNGMPVELMAMSYSAYHELQMRPGYILLLSLVIYPYEGDERDIEEEVPSNGAKVPLLDLVQRIVGEDSINRIPKDGWTSEELHRITDGTKYDGVGAFADWACSNTGCVVLDSSYENCDYEEGSGEPTFLWTKRNVDILTSEWPRVQEIRGKIDHIVEWLEADPIGRFRELLEFLLKTEPAKTRKRRKRGYYDPFEHHCELDQDNGEEEDDDRDDE